MHTTVVQPEITLEGLERVWKACHGKVRPSGLSAPERKIYRLCDPPNEAHSFGAFYEAHRADFHIYDSGVAFALAEEAYNALVSEGLEPEEAEAIIAEEYQGEAYEAV